MQTSRVVNATNVWKRASLCFGVGARCAAEASNKTAHAHWRAPG